MCVHAQFFLDLFCLGLGFLVRQGAVSDGAMAGAEVRSSLPGACIAVRRSLEPVVSKVSIPSLV